MKQILMAIWSSLFKVPIVKTAMFKYDLHNSQDVLDRMTELIKTT